MNVAYNMDCLDGMKTLDDCCIDLTVTSPPYDNLRDYGTPFQTLADRYGVSKKTIQNAIKGVTWKCVPYMPEPPKEENAHD